MIKNKIKYIVFSLILSLFAIGLVSYTLAAEADKPDFPSMKITTVPETIQPNGEVTLSIQQEGFTGENLFTNWCVDNVPLNSFYAGSEDKIELLVRADGREFENSTIRTQCNEEGNTVCESAENETYYVVSNDGTEEGPFNEAKYVPKISNAYGRVIGGSGFCSTAIRPFLDDFAWWAQTNISKRRVLEFIGLFLENFSPTYIVPSAVQATLVGLDEVNFLEPPILDDVIPAPDKSKNPVFEDLQNNLGLPASAFRVDGEEIWLLTDNNRKAIDAGVELLQENDYVAEEDNTYTIPGTDPPQVKAQIRVRESYEYIATDEVSDEVEKYEKQGYEIDVRWNRILEEGESEPKTYIVKVRFFKAPESKVNIGLYEQYFENTFGVPANADDSRLVALDYYFSKIADYYRNQRWDQTRDHWNNGRKENKILMQRIFHRLDNDDDSLEGEIFIDEEDDTNPDNGLPSYKDRDLDGMPDLWEMKMFGSLAGQKVTKGKDKKAKIHFPPCCTFSEDEINAFLLSVSPTDDWDSDGFKWKDKAYRESKRSNRFYPEPWVAGLGPYIGRNRYVPGGEEEIGIGEEKGTAAKPGDEKFTNYEEFVAGTNPVMVDSDNDAVPDELDFYGLNQDTISIELNKPVTEDDYFVTARSYGPITRGTIAKEPDFSRTDAFLNIKQGGGLDLEVQLARTPDPATLTDTIEISAGVGNLQNTDEKLLYFKWYLNGQAVPGAPGEKYATGCPCTPEAEKLAEVLGTQSGFGKDTLTFPASFAVNRACDAATVMLEVIDPNTEQTTTESIEVPISMETILVKSVQGNLPDTEEGEGAVIEEGDQQLEDVSEADIGGFRESDLLKIEAKLFGYTEDACGVVPAPVEGEEGVEGVDDRDRYMNSLIYNWTIDGVERNDISGKGKRSIDFQPTDEARISTEDRESQESSIEDDDHLIEVKIYDEDKNLISKKVEGLKVLGPSVNLVARGDTLKRRPTDRDGDLVLEANDNSVVIIRAEAQYFRPATSYEYTWTRNGEVIGEPTVVDSPLSELTILVGEDNEQPDDGIAVSIVTKDEMGEVVQDASNDITINIIEVEGINTELGGFLEKLIPERARNLFKLTAAFAVMALGIALFAGYNKK